MIRFLAVVERDLRKFLRNPLVILVSIVMPVVYLVILGNSLQGELRNITVAVVDMDRGPFADRVIERLYALQAGPGTIMLVRVADQGKAMEGLKSGRFKGVLIIPTDFSRDIMRGKNPELGLFLDNAETVSADTLRMAITGAIGEIERDFLPVRTRTSIPSVREVNLYKKVDYDQSLIPGVVIMAIFLGTMTTGAFNLVMDRFLGIEESYFLTPLTRYDIVMGLMVSGLIVTTVLALFVLFASSLISGIYLWKVLTLHGFVLLTVIIVLSTLGLLGLMFIIMGRINHPRIVGVLGGFLNVIFFFPSGAIYPVESFPWWLKGFAIVNPETYSVHALRAILFKGADIEAVKGDILFLSVFAVVALLIGILVFKRGL